jgi:dihydroflavonol-4-reductase
MSQTVLLTGISGFIGLYCAKELLNAGFKVKGTVRNSVKQQQVIEAMKSNDISTINLQFFELDLTSDNGWDKAMKGCDFVMHVASPFRIANPKDENEMLLPAVEGTKRVLKAANKASVKKVIMTSSIVSMMSSIRRGQFGPEDWTDINYPNLNTYIKSKTLAEKAAWTFIDQHKASSKMELVVIAPGGVFGPPLGNDISGETLTILSKMMNGKIPMVPDTAFPMVDVRDVAKLHVQAILTRGTAGKRFIAAGTEPIGFADVAEILLKQGYKGPSTKKAPSWLLKFMSIFDREAKGMLGILGMHLTADNSNTKKIFNWVPIPFAKSVIETANAIKIIQTK